MKKKAKKAVKTKNKKVAKKKKPAVKKAVKKAAKKRLNKTTKVSASKKAAKTAKPAVPEKKPPEPYKPKYKGPQTVYLGLGSNVGDREEYIEQAVTVLKETPGIKVVRRASNYETEPEGNARMASFINSAVEITTKLDPYELLAAIQSIEDTLGRDREAEWGPRTIDIDILTFGKEVLSDDKLTIPHPLMHERMFVLEPLREIAPLAVHPVLEKTVSDLFNEKKAEVSEKYDDELPGFREIKRGIADDYERW